MIIIIEAFYSSCITIKLRKYHVFNSYEDLQEFEQRFCRYYKLKSSLLYFKTKKSM